MAGSVEGGATPSSDATLSSACSARRVVSGSRSAATTSCERAVVPRSGTTAVAVPAACTCPRSSAASCAALSCAPSSSSPSVCSAASAPIDVSTAILTPSICAILETPRRVSRGGVASAVEHEGALDCVASTRNGESGLRGGESGGGGGGGGGCGAAFSAADALVTWAELARVGRTAA